MSCPHCLETALPHLLAQPPASPRTASRRHSPEPQPAAPKPGAPSQAQFGPGGLGSSVPLLFVPTKPSSVPCAHRPCCCGPPHWPGSSVQMSPPQRAFLGQGDQHCPCPRPTRAAPHCPWLHGGLAVTPQPQQPSPHLCCRLGRGLAPPHRSRLLPCAPQPPAAPTITSMISRSVPTNSSLNYLWFS